MGFEEAERAELVKPSAGLASELDVAGKLSHHLLLEAECSFSVLEFVLTQRSELVLEKQEESVSFDRPRLPIWNKINFLTKRHLQTRKDQNDNYI